MLLLQSMLQCAVGDSCRLQRQPMCAVQVAIEVGIGVCTKTTAEYTKRGDDFKSQLDFVFANLVM